jgi:hypothetical protein, TIGR02147
MNLPSIYGYNDFRKFLTDYQTAREEQDVTFTKSAICKRLGIPNSRSYLKDVENGKKVTPTYVERFVKVLNLNNEEAQFFRMLVKFNQAENAEERELYLDQLISLNKTPKRTIDQNAFSFFREWHHSVIRAMLDVMNFKDDYKLLSKALCPRVSLKKIKESITLLKSLGLIKSNENGYWKPSEKSVSTSDYMRDDLIVQYQIQCLDLAKQALIRQHDRPQKISTNTISLSNDCYIRIQKKIEKFKGEIRSLVHKDGKPSDYVYQLNIQLFPAAKISRDPPN